MVFAVVPKFGAHPKIRDVFIQNMVDWDYSFAVPTK